jgi:hypothetical protein
MRCSIRVHFDDYLREKKNSAVILIMDFTVKTVMRNAVHTNLGKLHIFECASYIFCTFINFGFCNPLK